MKNVKMARYMMVSNQEIVESLIESYEDEMARAERLCQLNIISDKEVETRAQAMSNVLYRAMTKLKDTMEISEYDLENFEACLEEA